jgi:hypothetical protein
MDKYAMPLFVRGEMSSPARQHVNLDALQRQMLG